jgi:hypothetical protein
MFLRQILIEKLSYFIWYFINFLLEHNKNEIYRLKICKLADPLPVCALYVPKKMNKLLNLLFHHCHSSQHNGLKICFYNPKTIRFLFQKSFLDVFIFYDVFSSI